VLPCTLAVALTFELTFENSNKVKG
jgi:hypothetical protein